MVLVMIVLAVGSILTLSFVASQSTAVAMATNANRQAQARALAEDAGDLVLAYLAEDPAWRDEFTHGEWSSMTPAGGGEIKFRLLDEVDSDLSDDPAEAFVLETEGSYLGTVHRLRREVAPEPQREDATTVLLVADERSPSEQDRAKAALFESWGFSVVMIADDATASAYQAAIADADVLYISEEASSVSMGSKLVDLAVGIVNEEWAYNDDLLLATSVGSYWGRTIEVVQAGHPIMRGLSAGSISIAAADTDLADQAGSIAPGAEVLATRSGSTHPALLALERGGQRADGTAAPGRRVSLPFAGSAFDVRRLDANGKQIMRQAIEWAAAEEADSGLIHRWPLDEIGGVTASDVQGNAPGSFTYSPSLGRAGQVNRAAEFTVAGDRVTLPIETVNGLTDLTYSFWFKTTKTGEQALLSGASASNNNAQLVFLFNSTTIKYYDGSASGSFVQWTCPSFADDQWHQLTLTRDQTAGQVTAYLDGNSLGSRSKTMSAVSVEHLVLAEEQDSVDGGYMGSQALVGLLDEVRFYDRPLSATEAAKLYQQTSERAGEPKLVSLYEFDPPPAVTPQLVGHWKLDEVGSSSGQAAIGGQLRMINGPLIDSYDSKTGAYPGSAASAAKVSTNSTAADQIYLSENAQIRGSVYGGPGGNMSSIVRLTHTASITGAMEPLPSTADLSVQSPPAMPLAASSYNVYSNLTLNQDFRVGSGTVYNNSVVTVSGHRTLVVDSNLTIQDGRFDIPQGSSLTLYVGGNLSINNQSWFNNDSLGVDRLTVHLHGSASSLLLPTNARVAGSFFVRNNASLTNSSQLYGRLIVGNGLVVRDSAQLHLDAAASAEGGLTFAADELANDGAYQGGAAGGQPGHGDGGTAASLNGTDAFVEVPHQDAYLLNEGTVGLWLRIDDPTREQAIFAKDSQGFDSGGHLRLLLTGGTLRAELQSSSATYVAQSGGGLIQANTWHHVAVGFGPGGMRLFLDGQLIATNAYAGGMGSSSGGSGNYEPWTFGVDQSQSSDLSTDGWTLPLRGQLDDVKIFDRNLTDTQVSDWMGGGAPRSMPGPDVLDTAGRGEPIDLLVADPQRITWLVGGGLRIDQPTMIASPVAAARLAGELQGTGHFTIEVEFAPADLGQTGPARVLRYGGNSSSVNVELAQSDATYRGRMRSIYKSESSAAAVSGSVLTTGRQHVILTYDGAELRMYRDGAVDAAEPWTGGLDNWDSSYRFALGSAGDGSQPWTGTLYRVAIWDESVNPLQAGNLFNGDPPGPPASITGYRYPAEWIESP